jgi:uncharacterized protein (DUF58 family)
LRNNKRLKLFSAKGAFSELVGNNLSSLKGDGFEFMELRAYESGDDIRRIDWKSTAKMGQPYVKEFIAERELNVVVILLISGSMHFGLQRLKSDVAHNVIQILGLSAIANSDRFSFISYAKEIEFIQKASKSLAAIHRVSAYLESLSYLQKELDLVHFEQKIISLLKRKSVVFILSDFVGSYSFSKLAKRHEVIPIIIRDSAEESPPPLGGISLIDPVSYKQDDAISALALSEYAKQLQLNDTKLHESFIKSGMRFVKIKTDEDEYIKLKRFFKRK